MRVKGLEKTDFWGYV